MSSHPRLLFRLSQTSVTPRRFLFSYFQRTSPCLRSTFSTTRQCASKKTRSVSPPKIPSKPRKAPPSSTYKPFTQTIAERSEPTLLYQGGSNTIYIAGCYSLGLLILAWTVHAAGQVYYHPPPFFNRFLKSMFYGACVLTVSMGTFFIIRVKQLLWALIISTLTRIALSHHPNHPSPPRLRQRCSNPPPPNRKRPPPPRYSTPYRFRSRHRHLPLRTAPRRKARRRIPARPRTTDKGGGKGTKVERRQFYDTTAPTTGLPSLERVSGAEGSIYKQPFHLFEGKGISRELEAR